MRHVESTRPYKRGPYSSYEFKDACVSMPRSTEYALANPPPPKKRRNLGDSSCVAACSVDNAPVTASSTLEGISLECNYQPCQNPPLDLPGGVTSNHPQFLPCVVACDEPCNISLETQEVHCDKPPDGTFDQPQDVQQDFLQWHFVREDHDQACGDSFNDSFNEDEENDFDGQEDGQASFVLEDDHAPPPEDPGDSSDDESVVAAAPDLHFSVPERIKVLLLLAAKLRHRLTYSAAECIMRLAGVWSKDFSFVPSKHMLKSAISLYSSSLSVHHICPNCKVYVGEIFDESLECPNCSTEINAKCNKKQGNVFLYISVAEQIKSLLVHSGLFHELINPQHRQRIQQGTYEDIMDGKFYKVLVRPGSISFNFFVDGLQVRSTSKNSAWPVLVSINELPLHLRRKHILMASVWLGKKKPVMNEYLKPFVRECIELERDGISFKINGFDKTLKVIPLVCISDSVARPTLRNATQFNGDYGCGLCYHPGFSMRRGRGHCRSYSIAEREFPSRTHEETMQNARNAEALGTPQQGIKGLSILSEIPGFDIINCLDLDLFHALVNCAKRFTNLWLSRRYSGRPFNVHARFGEVDRRLLSITPNDNVSRNPRSLSERSDYRGHEWFSWVVFYSVPVLTKILPNPFLSHWALLVHGIVLLMQNSVSKADVVYAGRFLRQFNAEVDRLYGAEHVTFSTHLLTHLEKSTYNFAQPWTHSALVYENFLGELKSDVHSGNGIAHQICKHIQLRIALKKMHSDLNYAMSDIERDFLSSVSCSSKVLAEPRMTVEDVGFLGDSKNIVLSPNLHRVLLRGGFQPVVGKEYLMFDRCISNDEVFQSVNYQRAEKQNNSIVLLKSDQVFEIHSFIVIDNVPAALGHYLVRNRTPLCNVVLPHIKIFNDKCEANLRCARVSNFDMKLLSYSLSISCEQSLRFGCVNVLEMEMLH